ncbi:inovirus-type Gp2 protein [Rhodanobacter sp. OR87]|uniref:YagK/YfjJ domain-containing protein n=1 Tax=Rhodanobacter sp. OR87 TaxID=1076523 RepID=UPI000488C4B7|nr:inovirus-type Gp2 protein [Rhodanobacter sp. OR87]
MLTSSINVPDSDCEEDRTYLGQTIADILRREQAHEQVADKIPYLQTPDGPEFRYDIDDQLMLDFMPSLIRLHARLMASDAPPVAATFVRWAQRPGFKLTTLGRQVLSACLFFGEREDEGRNWQHAYADHQFHPVIAVMFRAVARWWSAIREWTNPDHAMIDCTGDMKSVEALQYLVDYVRRVCRTQAFKNVLHDHERKAKDNFRSGRDYITEQFERHARLLVLRVDLYFRPDAKGWAYCKVADMAVINYLRALRLGRIVPGYLGFIIKRENGISRGLHYHLMVFLDGHLHRNAYHLTQRMGEAWVRRAGTDKGSFFNCYARKDLFRYNGLGLVHVSDTAKLIGIRIALWYMSKQDCVLMVDDSKVKNFWRGWKVKGHANRGAPRKNGNDMALVKRLLGGDRSKYPPSFEPPKNGRADRMAVGPRIAAM